jgi:DNA repair protein RadC
VTYQYMHESDVVEAALQIMAARCSARQVLNSPADTISHLRLKYGPEQREVFVMLTLDSHYRLLAEHEVCRGTLDMVQPFPRELLALALKDGADFVVFCHNHPSGTAQPSRNDCAMTAQMLPLFGACNIGILDHIIVSQEEHFSMALAGVMDKLNAYGQTIAEMSQVIGKKISLSGV